MIESLTRQGVNVQHACRTLGVSVSGYYDWRGRPDPPRTLRRIWLAGEVADVHKALHDTSGALRVTAALRYGRDIQVGHNAVGDIMRVATPPPTHGGDRPDLPPTADVTSRGQLHTV